VLELLVVLFNKENESTVSEVNHFRCSLFLVDRNRLIGRPQLERKSTSRYGDEPKRISERSFFIIRHAVFIHLVTEFILLEKEFNSIK